VRTVKRELQLAVLLCLLGSGIVLFAVSRTWVSFGDLDRLTISSLRTSVSGRRVSPGTAALGYVGLAGVLALAATRRSGRVAVGLLVLAAGAGLVVTSARVLVERSSTLALHAAAPRCQGSSSCFVGVQAVEVARVWPALALVGGVLLCLSGLLVTARGRRWAALSSAYEPPASPPAQLPEIPVTDKAVWDALDRGEDPTGT